jgi:hypothetical protein
MALPPLPSDEALLASVSDLQGQQPSLRHRLDGYSEPPSPPSTFSQNHEQQGQAVARTLGPFQDDLGRAIAVDVFVQTAFTGFQFAGQSEPVLWGEQPRRLASGGGGLFFILAEGRPSTVWLSTSLFPSLEFRQDLVGLRVSRALLRINAQPASIALGGNLNPIIIPAAASISLILTLLPEPIDAGSLSTPGEYAVQTPQHATFQVLSNSITLTSSDPAQLTVLGTSLNLSRLAASPIYDETIGCVGFPFSPDLAQLSALHSSAALGTWDGSAGINAAFWALPITYTPRNLTVTTNLPSASGAGGISLHLQTGLSITITDQDRPVQCGPCTLLARGSALLVTGQSASGGRDRQQTIRLPGSSTFTPSCLCLTPFAMSTITTLMNHGLLLRKRVLPSSISRALSMAYLWPLSVSADW